MVCIGQRFQVAGPGAWLVSRFRTGGLTQGDGAGMAPSAARFLVSVRAWS